MIYEDKFYEELVETVELIESQNKIKYNIDDKLLILLRNQIVKWIWKVMILIDVSKKTIFEAIDIFDSVLENFDLHDTEDLFKDLNLISIVSMVIASKFQEVNYIGFDLIQSLSKTKFRKLEIIKMERLIMLNTPIKVNYLEEFVYLIFKTFKNSTSSNETFDFKFKVLKYCNIVYFRAVKDYGFYKKRKTLYFYFAVFYISVNKSKCVNIDLNNHIFSIAKYFNLKKKSLIECIEELENLI